MRVTWIWANRPDDESVERAVHHCRRTTRNSVEDDNTQRPTPPPRHHFERNTRHV